MAVSAQNRPMPHQLPTLNQARMFAGFPALGRLQSADILPWGQISEHIARRIANSPDCTMYGVTRGLPAGRSWARFRNAGSPAQRPRRVSAARVRLPTPVPPCIVVVGVQWARAPPDSVHRRKIEQ
jgi:hypothetical protein